MIPKVIHYCWFGGNPLPQSGVRCIETWKRHFPDYEIKCWDESNFNVNIIPYTAQAYASKKYAFVSDYARFWILYKYGGLYFDTDVEVIRPMDDIISAGPFMGCEIPYVPGATLNSLGVNPGLGLGAPPGHALYKEIMDMYAHLHFVNSVVNLKTVVEYTTELLSGHNVTDCGNGFFCVEGIRIYPAEYFSPKSYVTKKIKITENTRTIHHFAGTWQPWWKKVLLRIWVPFSKRYPQWADRIKHLF